jgi:endonuclease-3 related protein
VKKVKLEEIYSKLYASFGPQHWWPAENSFEVIVGAILTQNTAWTNVEKAITNLKKAGLLDAHKLYQLPQKKLAALIRPAGFYNIKARRLKEFLNFFSAHYRLNLEKMLSVPVSTMRRQLLAVHGIGAETADSILLYALAKPSFVVDNYTKRILSRHKLIQSDADYAQVQALFMQQLKKNSKLFNEFHALLVRLAKDFCLKNKPRCAICPLKKIS